MLAGVRLVLEAETSSSGYQAVSLRLETGAEQHTVQVSVSLLTATGHLVIPHIVCHVLIAGGVLPQLASPECPGQ